MTTIICYASAGIFIVLIRLINGRWPIGYLSGGLYYGIYNEICFEFCWDYHPELGPMIWRDVPLIIIIGWSAYAAMSLVLVDRIFEKFHLKNPILRKIADVLLFFSIGYPLEVVMSRFNLWSYNDPLQAALWIQILGYIFAGILVSAIGRQLQSFLEHRPSFSSSH